MNIDPSIWGPSAWNIFHYITIGYPDNPNDETKKSAYNFFMSLKNLLPCEKCRYNFNQHLQMYPLTDDILMSKDKLINWLIDIHNNVNKTTGKQIMSYYDAHNILMHPKRTIESFSNVFDNFMNLRTLTIVIILFLLILMIIIMKYCWSS